MTNKTLVSTAVLKLCGMSNSVIKQLSYYKTHGKYIAFVGYMPLP